MNTAEIRQIAERATAHNFGQTVFEVHDHGDYLAVRMSSWPRCREAQRALEAQGYSVEIPNIQRESWIYVRPAVPGGESNG